MITSTQQKILYIWLWASTLIWSIIYSRNTIILLSLVYLFVISTEFWHLFDKKKTQDILSTYIYTPSIIVAVCGLVYAICITRNRSRLISLFIATYIFSYTGSSKIGQIWSYTLSNSNIALLSSLCSTFVLMQYIWTQDIVTIYTIACVSIRWLYCIFYTILQQVQKKNPLDIITDMIRLILTAISLCMLIYSLISSYIITGETHESHLSNTYQTPSVQYRSTPMVPIDLCQ